MFSASSEAMAARNQIICRLEILRTACIADGQAAPKIAQKVQKATPGKGTPGKDVGKSAKSGPKHMHSSRLSLSHSEVPGTGDSCERRTWSASNTMRKCLQCLPKR